MALARLRIAYFEFIAEHLRHMNHEERVMLPATQRWASDEQRAATLGRIIGGLSPEMYATWMRWMLPALMPDELAGMLRGLVNAPAQLMATVERVAADSFHGPCVGSAGQHPCGARFRASHETDSHSSCVYLRP